MRTVSPGSMAAALGALLVGAARAGAPASAAQPAPPNTVRAGLYAVFYHASAQNLSGRFVPPGLNFTVDDVQTLYLAYVRRLTTHFHLELAIGIPPTTSTRGRGPARLGSLPYNDQVLSTDKWLAPSLLINYVFFDETHALRPYVGVGLNYTSFFDRRSTAAGDAVSGGPTRLSLSSSVGPVADIGLSYRFDRRWSAYASYSFSRVRSTLTADTAGVIRTTRISFGPQVLVIAAGYSF